MQGLCLASDADPTPHRTGGAGRHHGEPEDCLCDVLDCASWNIRDMRPSLDDFKPHVKIQICCYAQLDAGIWMPRLRTWLPQSRQSKALMYNYLRNESGDYIDGPELGFWCMHCNQALWTRQDEDRVRCSTQPSHLACPRFPGVV